MVDVVLGGAVVLVVLVDVVLVLVVVVVVGGGGGGGGVPPPPVISTSTEGELARATGVFPATEASDAPNVELPEALGAMAPGPPPVLSP